MAALEEKLAEAVRQFRVLYDKSCRDFKDNSKKRLAWEDVANTQGFQIHLDFSFLKILHVPTTFSFLGFVADVFSVAW